MTTTEDRELVISTGLQLWESRRKAQNMDIKHKRTIELQAEFLLGMVGILDAIRANNESCISPSIYFSIIRGEYITNE